MVRASSGTLLLSSFAVFVFASPHLMSISLALATTIGTGSRSRDGGAPSDSNPGASRLGSFAGHLFARSSDSPALTQHRQEPNKQSAAHEPQPTTSAEHADAAIEELLARLGPDMRPTGGYREAPGVGVGVAQRAWRKMRRHAARLASDRIEHDWPLVESALVEANVSGECLKAAAETAAGARRLESWAVQRK